MFLKSFILILCFIFISSLSLADKSFAAKSAPRGELEKGTSARAAALDAKRQSIIPISAFTAKGDTKKLKRALVNGLESGLTVNEIKEILIQMYAYTGFPRSLTALDVFMNLVTERKKNGIEDNTGKEATPLPQGANIREIGTANQTAVVGQEVKGPIFEFAPAMDVFLKEHLFGAIFARDVLTFQDRELATISALASLPAPNQLRSHLNCSLVVGLTEAELRGFVATLKKKVGKEEANLAEKTLNEVLKARELTK